MGLEQRGSTNPQQPWQVRLRSVDGVVLGAGMLLRGTWVLTCAHVVEEHLDGPVLVDVISPEAEGAPRRARVLRECWWPPQDDRYDLAVLQVDTAFPREWSAPLRQLPVWDRGTGEQLWNREVGMLGFPEDEPTGAYVTGVLMGNCGNGAERVYVSTSGSPYERIRRGFSGTGVVDKRGAVLGMVVSAEEHAEVGRARMVPVDVMVGRLGLLQESVGGRGVSDPVFTSGERIRLTEVELTRQAVAFFDRGRPKEVMVVVAEDDPHSPDFQAVRWIVVLADRRLRSSTPDEVVTDVPAGTVPAAGSVDLALDVVGKTVEEIASRMCQRLGILSDPPLTRLLEFKYPINAVFHGVEQAAQPERLVQDVVTPLRAEGSRFLLVFRSESASQALMSGVPHTRPVRGKCEYCRGSVLDSGYCDSCDRPPWGRLMPTVREGTGQWLAAGLVPLPILEFSPPEHWMPGGSEIPKNHRKCRNCGAWLGGRNPSHQPVGEQRRCPHCEQPFAFEPRLRRGDRVEGRYHVLGCLAAGGNGWIFLAEDTRLDNHLVVLKGLLDINSRRSRELAVRERRVLTELNHSGIVRIINFVSHTDERSNEAVDYLVMEYVEGLSLQEMMQWMDRLAATGEPLLLEHVLAYGCELLQALEYLHGNDLLYCDMKPHNVIRRRDRITLIDLGGVRRVDDHRSPVVGTKGYLVDRTERDRDGLTVRSDLYAVGKTLEKLFAATEDGVRRDQPTAIAFGVESFHRLIAKATHEIPTSRFASADEMAGQARGVLREILCLRDGQARPEPSSFFKVTPVLLDAGLGTVPPLETWTGGTPAEGQGIHRRPRLSDIAAGLPAPRSEVADSLDRFDEADAQELLHALNSKPANSVEVHLCRCQAFIKLPDLDEAKKCLKDAETIQMYRNPDDWRLHWHRGLLALATGAVPNAAECFSKVRDALPGESAPTLALGFCAEHANKKSEAKRCYEAVWRRDPAQASAAFGLARIHLADGDRRSAAEALERVPETSRHYNSAATAMVRCRCALLSEKHEFPSEEDWHYVVQKYPQLKLDGDSAVRLKAEIHGAALQWVRAGPPVKFDGGDLLGGTDVDERSLRSLLEKSLRALGEQARTVADHDVLIDLANEIRPRTLW